MILIAIEKGMISPPHSLRLISSQILPPEHLARLLTFQQPN